MEQVNTFPLPPALWRLGFRPFFLAGGAWAAVALPLWVFWWLGGGGWRPAGGGWLWHQHEMVFGVAGAVVAGFVLTAAQNWTGVPSPRGRALALLALAWLLGRLAWLLALPGTWVMVLDGLFLPLVALVVTAMLARVRQRRNYPVALVLWGLAGANGISLVGLASGQLAWAVAACKAGLWLVVLMVTLIGGRVIPLFVARALGRAMPVPLPWLEWPAHGLMLLLAALAVMPLAIPPLAMALLCGLAALVQGIRWWRWRQPGQWSSPLLWSLILGYAWLPIGLALLAVAALWPGVPASAGLHAIAAGGLGGLILAMMPRVTLGHTGRALEAPSGLGVMLVLLHVGVLARLLAGLLPGWNSALLVLAALGWTLAFGGFVWRFGPMLCRPRVDGGPG